jgi:hypothetical protein
MPSEYERKWQAAVSLDLAAVRDSLGPILTDEGPYAAWRAALDELLVDPDAPLPRQV